MGLNPTRLTSSLWFFSYFGTKFSKYVDLIHLSCNANIGNIFLEANISAYNQNKLQQPRPQAKQAHIYFLKLLGGGKKETLFL